MSNIKYGCLLLGSVIFFYGCGTNRAITDNDQVPGNAVDTEQQYDSTAEQNLVTVAKPIEAWHLLGAITAMEASANEWTNQGIALYQAYSLLDSTARSPKKLWWQSSIQEPMLITKTLRIIFGSMMMK